MIAAETKSRVAAFFDLDGTLLPLPSLERRLAAALRHRRAIPAGNYFRWLGEALRLAPQGINAVTQANKMYLHNLSTKESSLAAAGAGTPVHAESQIAGVHVNQAASASTTTPRRRQFPAFFPAAVDRISWHVGRGHAIVLVTGSPAPLASEAALVLVLRLMARGLTGSIAVSATQLEQSGDHWTGRIKGEAIFGKAKLRALQRIATSKCFDLSRSYAYGDSTEDKWMLGAVGRPVAVNPSRELERIVALRDWPILRWNENDSQNGTASAAPGYRIRIDRTVLPNIESETLG
jgi:HAD superfamily hydrolase (TIGR01490 family)